jgi:hypothetical protein
VDELRYGYTLTDLDRLARSAVHAPWASSLDYRDRYDAAWHAIAELLYSSAQRPSGWDLKAAGMNAVSVLGQNEARHHGYDHQAQDRPHFQRYWALYRVTPSHEDRVVDRVALTQIWPTLTGTQRQALLALAVHEDHERAAAAIDRTPTTYRAHVKDGRARFRALWHEGETPSRMWGRSMGALVGQRTATQVLVCRRRKRARRERAA